MNLRRSLLWCCVAVSFVPYAVWAFAFGDGHRDPFAWASLAATVVVIAMALAALGSSRSRNGMPADAGPTAEPEQAAEAASRAAPVTDEEATMSGPSSRRPRPRRRVNWLVRFMEWSGRGIARAFAWLLSLLIW